MNGKYIRTMRSAMLALAVLAIASPAGAQDTLTSAPDAERVVGHVTEGIPHLAHGHKLACTELKGRLKNALDLQMLTRFALGRHYARLSDEERTRFHDVFSRHAIATYAFLLKESGDGPVRVTASLRTGANSAAVATVKGTADDEPLRWTWRLHRRDGSFKIVDLQSSATSLAVTYRTEIGAMLVHGGFEDTMRQIGPSPQGYRPLPAEKSAILRLLGRPESEQLAFTSH